MTGDTSTQTNGTERYGSRGSLFHRLLLRCGDDWAQRGALSLLAQTHLLKPLSPVLGRHAEGQGFDWAVLRAHSATVTGVERSVILTASAIAEGQPARKAEPWLTVADRHPVELHRALSIARHRQKRPCPERIRARATHPDSADERASPSLHPTVGADPSAVPCGVTAVVPTGAATAIVAAAARRRPGDHPNDAPALGLVR